MARVHAIYKMVHERRHLLEVFQVAVGQHERDCSDPSVVDKVVR